MSDYRSGYTGAQIDNILSAVNKNLAVPGSESNDNLVGSLFGGIVTASGSPAAGTTEVFYIAKTPGTYTEFNNITLVAGEVVVLTYNGTNWVKTPIATSNVRYVECNTSGGTAVKNVDITGFLLGNDIRLLIKMVQVNTAANAYLTVNSQDMYPLFYKGARADASNTWKQGEVLDVYFDGTNYQARAGVTVVQTIGQDPDVVMSQKAVTDELTSIKQEIWPLELTFSHNVGNPIEYTGSNVNATLSWTCKRQGAAMIPSSEIITQDGTTIDSNVPPAAASGTKATTVNKLGSTGFVLTIQADGMTKTASTSINQVLPMYVGFYAHGSSATANTMKGSLTKKIANSISSLGGTYKNPTNGYDLVILVPNDKTITKVVSGGFEVPMSAATTDTSINIGGAKTYKIYKSASATGINAGNMTITVQ